MSAYYLHKLHKQTAMIAIVCIAAVAGTVAYVHWQTPQNQDAGQQAVLAATTSAPIISSTDWKKAFFASSAINTTVVGGATAAAGGADQPLTLTDQMGRNFFARYIQLKQNGLDGNPQLVQDTINQTLDETASAASVPKKYALSDILVSPKADAASLHAYGNAVGAVFMDQAPSQNPVLIANDAFSKGDLGLLSQIDPVIAWYGKTISRLRAIPAPQPMAQDHVDMVNAASMMLYVSQSLRNIQGDPMQSVLALGLYAKVQQADIASVESVNAYFNANHISFAANEPGMVFSLITKQQLQQPI